MRFSVIVPVHNGEGYLQRCLQALFKSSRKPDEIVVVDDASTDSSADCARQGGARVLSLANGPNGPAAARNRGAGIAEGDVLVFVDADVMVHPDTLLKVEHYLASHPDVPALFGSYDDSPPHRGLVTLYKNLQHHFVHQHGQREASTFWAGAGAIRRDVFLKMGGFDERYARPSVEDIELGLRLRRAGFRIWLCPDILVTHLKRWTLASWLRADILDRAIPWTLLILSSGDLPSDLNLDVKSRSSAVLAWGMLGLIGLGLWNPWVWAAALLTAVLFVVFNADLYFFFAQRGGLAFTVGAVVLHVLYFLYSSLVFGCLSGWHLVRSVGGMSARATPRGNT